MNIEEIKPQNLRNVYMEIAEAYDVETAIKIQKLFGGQRITFPKKLYRPDYVCLYIKSTYNGRNIQKLARQFEISERRVRQILRKP